MAQLDTDKPRRIDHLPAVAVERIEPFDIMVPLRALWHGKFLILFAVSLAVGLAGYYAFAIATPRFAATVDLEMHADTTVMMGAGQPTPSLTLDPARINTEVAMLRSRHLLEQVVTTLSLRDDPEFNRYLTPDNRWSLRWIRTRLRNALTGQVETLPNANDVLEKTIENLRGAVSVGSLRDTYVFRITATTGAAERSELIANTLANLYLADQVAAKRSNLQTTLSWLSDRVYELQQQLYSKETAVNDMIASQRVNDAAVLDALSRQSSEARERLDEARRALVDAESKLQRYDAGSGAFAASTAQPDRIQLVADVQRYANQTTALEVFRNSIDAELAEQSAGLVRLQQLRREAEGTRVLYESFLARLQEASLQSGMQSPDSRILSIASPGTYVAPRKMLILLIAAILGAVAGMVLVFASTALRQGFDTSDALAGAMALPVLAQIPRMPARTPQQLLNHLHRSPTSAGSDACRILRTALMAEHVSTSQVIMSTSSLPREGKTTTAIAVAHGFAALGKTVLLVGTDMRQRTRAGAFPQKSGHLMQVLTGEMPLAAAVGQHATLGADVVVANQIKQNPADIFASPAFGTFIAQARTSYDVVILDAPAVLSAPEALLQAQHCDVLLYNVRWRATDAHTVRAGLDTLESVGVLPRGLILTNVDVRKLRQRHVSGFTAPRSFSHQGERLIRSVSTYPT